MEISLINSLNEIYDELKRKKDKIIMAEGKVRIKFEPLMFPVEEIPVFYDIDEAEKVYKNTV